MTIKLHDSVIGDGPDVVLLHGLFGQGSNLGSIARALQDEFRVHSPDLPDHGHSDWLEEGSISRYADAIAQWMHERHLDGAHFIGHSLGGKVAMELALNQPALVDRLVIADIAPVAYEPSHGAVFEGMRAVEQAACTSRKEAGEVLAQFVQEEGVRQFLLLSLMKTPEGTFTWRLNRSGLERHYASFRAAVTGELPFDGDALFIRGSLSDYVLDEYIPSIEALFTHARIETIEGTGHWLHVEKAAAFNKLVLEFLL